MKVARINYSDTTAPVTNTFDRLGRLITVNHGTSIATLSYNAAGALVSEP